MERTKVFDYIAFVDFFGILCPGVFVLIAFVLGVAGLSQTFETGPEALSRLESTLQNWAATVGLLGFFASYLVGSAIRLFANDFSEVLSGFYLTKVRRKREAIAKERFPYPFAGASMRTLNEEIYNWYKASYPYFGQEGDLSKFDRKYLFNRCKADLYARDPQRARFHERVESFVRFLAGSLVSSLILLCVCLPLAVYFVFTSMYFIASIYGAFSLGSLLIVTAILERFRQQHTREVMALWVSYYDTCNQ